MGPTSALDGIGCRSASCPPRLSWFNGSRLTESVSKTATRIWSFFPMSFGEIRADRFYLTILGSLTRQCVMNWKHLGTYLSHQCHQSATTGDLQLAEDGMKMFFHRFETQAAFVGNLLIAAPIAH